MVAEGVIDVILGEAGGRTEAERYADMVAIASVIQNRATLSGLTPKSVVSVKSEFNAYGKSLPKGVESYRDLAEQAWNQVQTTGPVHNATYYATSKAKSGLPDGLTPVTKTEGHEYFADPKGRSFKTAEGFVTPATETHAAMMSGNLVAPQNPYSGLVPSSSVQTVSLPQTAPAPVARADIPSAPGRTITPGAGLANLAPQTPSRPDGVNYGAVSYAHPDRGPWSAALTPAAVDSVNMMAARSPRGIGLTSAYRSPTHPVEARKAKGPGEHTRGTAYDMDLSGMNDAERAKAVETARMTGATRLGAYSRSPNMMHVDFAPGWTPTKGGVYAMMDTSRHNMARAPGWFTQGLDQVTVPTPTARPDYDPVSQAAQTNKAAYQDYGASRAQSRTPEQQATIDAYSDYGRSRMAAGTPVSAKGTATATPGVGVRGAGTVSYTPQPSATPQMSLPDFAPVPTSRPALDTAIAAPPQAGFPAPPPAPGRTARAEAAKGAALGALKGGPVGAILGGLIGPGMAQVRGNIASNRQGMGRVPIFNGIRGAYRGMFGNRGGGSMFSGIPAPNYGATPYNVGSGYGAIGSTFGGPAGAVAYSQSNPNISFTSLGNGYVSRTNKDTGVTYTMAPGDYDAGSRSSKSKSR